MLFMFFVGFAVVTVAAVVFRQNDAYSILK
jgi:hypothetical protein